MQARRTTAQAASTIETNKIALTAISLESDQTFSDITF